MFRAVDVAGPRTDVVGAVVRATGFTVNPFAALALRAQG